MKLEEVIEHSNLILLESNKKSGKLTFALFICLYIYREENVLIISSYDKTLFIKRINVLKELPDKKLSAFLDKINFLNAKHSFMDLKIKYGLDFLLQDIKRATIHFNTKVLILHRIEVFFDIQDFEEAKKFILSLIGYLESQSIKLIITIEKQEERPYFIDFIENLIDTTIILNKNESNIEVKIEDTIFPIQSYKYNFVIKDDKLFLETVLEEVELKKDILVISNNQFLISMVNYLLEDKLFNIIIANNIAEILNISLNNPDVIIFNSDSDNLNSDICHFAKKIGTKVFYISNREFVRVSEKMHLIKEGCFDILPKNFNFEEYMLELQKVINNFFYLKKIDAIKKSHKKLIKDEKEFETILNRYLKDRIYFTLIITKQKVNTDLLRDYDVVFENSITKIIILDITKYQVEPIIKKLNIEEAEIISANELKDQI